MGKGQKGSFFASDDKAENHINEGEGKKILRARKMKGGAEENNLGPGLFIPFFESKIPGPRVEKRKKTRVALLVFILATFSATFSKIQLDQAH